ncbi:MAG: hypothetical protein V4671_05675 [Armatimonadota bacterium]
MTDRINSQALIESTEQYIEELKASRKLSADEYEARRVGKDIAEYEEYLAIKRRRMEQATRTIDEGKTALQREEERVREETAEVLHLTARWKKSAIWRRMRRELKESSTVFDRYQANPCVKTFAPLRKMQEGSRQHVAQCEQACENLKQMVSDLETIIEKLRRKAAAAQAKGDTITAESVMREQASFEQTLVSVRESVQQAKETVVDCHGAYARLEAFLVREAVRLAEGED